MKQIKSVFMFLSAVVLLLTSVVPASAQYYMHVVKKGGVIIPYKLSEVDSVYFSLEADMHDPSGPDIPDEPLVPDPIDVVIDSLAETGLYLGVMGFNQQLYAQPVVLFNTESKSAFDGFIDGLEMKNGTILCYSVEKALESLHAIQPPSNLSTVSLVTFTDGLDQGSLPKILYKYTTTEEYLDTIKAKISTDSILGVPITAYSIGLKGNDVSDNAKFQSTLRQLASSESLAFEVKDMAEVTAKFKEIAEQLNHSLNYQTVPIVIPGIDMGARIRFTFDNVSNAANSRLFIEGTFHVELNPLRYSLIDLSYSGMTSLSDSIVYGIPQEPSGHIKFLFEKVMTDDNIQLSKYNVKEWILSQDAQWQINSEFIPDQQPDIVTERSSAIIMLILDCSSSLGSQFSTVKSNAKSFINTLYNSYEASSDDSTNPSTAGYDYVDLGLSVKWATCNVGAEKPEDYGGYYAWGETEPKNDYSWSTYKWCNGSITTLTKYNTSSSYGLVDNKTVLDAGDDVAHVKWGGDWRMPTREEFNELLENCTWTWTTQNGVKGYKVTSRKTGYTDRSIFLPAAGYRNGTGLVNAGSRGDFWSSSLYTDSPYYAWNLYFSTSIHRTDYSYRLRGRSVRPVCP